MRLLPSLPGGLVRICSDSYPRPLPSFVTHGDTDFSGSVLLRQMRFAEETFHPPIHFAPRRHQPRSHQGVVLGSSRLESSTSDLDIQGPVVPVHDFADLRIVELTAPF